MPAGAGGRYWLNYLGLTHLSGGEKNFHLLNSATIAPIGHLRIKKAVENLPMGEKRLFDIDEVVNRHADFLDYANQMGAIAGGATGAGGEAPKLVLRLTDNDKVWIDHQQLADGSYDAQDSYYLVKFPRGARSEIDCDILRAEYHFYQELASLGFDTIETTQMRLIEGERYPSLWLPRFDVSQNTKGKTQRLAMESVYAMLKQQPATRLYHGQTLELGGRYNFIAICESLLDLIEPSILLEELKQTAEKCKPPTIPSTGFLDEAR